MTEKHPPCPFCGSPTFEWTTGSIVIGIAAFGCPRCGGNVMRAVHNRVGGALVQEIFIRPEEVAR